MPGVPVRVPMQQSAIRAMTKRCLDVGGINIGQGLCQVDPPAALLRAAAKGFTAASHGYSPAEGDPGLLRDLAAKLRRDNGIVVDPISEIVVTVGVTGALNATLLALLDPGDGVLVIEPCYGYHVRSARVFGLEPQPIRLANPWLELDEASMQAAITPVTKAIIVCTPANPTGRRLTSVELSRIAALAREHDLIVITDEIYEHIYYEETRHIAPASVAGLGDRTITISGFSKAYSIPGWRIGFAAGPRVLVERIRVAADALSVCAPTPLQQLSRHALALPPSYYTDLRRMYDRKRQRLSVGFEAVGLPVATPQGAYYLFVDCTPLAVADGIAASDLLLEKAKVATIPGEAFFLGTPDRPYVRACFSLPDRTLEAAATQLIRMSTTRFVHPPAREW